MGRDELIEELKKANIGTSVHFIPVHLHPFYRENYGTQAGDLPVTEQVFDEILSSPLPKNEPGGSRRRCRRVEPVSEEAWLSIVLIGWLLWRG